MNPLHSIQSEKRVKQAKVEILRFYLLNLKQTKSHKYLGNFTLKIWEMQMVEEAALGVVNWSQVNHQFKKICPHHVRIRSGGPELITQSRQFAL